MYLESSAPKRRLLYPVMAVDIVIADDSGPLIEAFNANDVARVYEQCSRARKRSIVFESEVLTGFVIHSSSKDFSATPPQKAYLATTYINNSNASPGLNLSTANVAGDVTITNPVGHNLDNSSSVILKHQILETITSSSNGAIHVTVWMFEYLVASVGHEPARLCLSASLRKNSDQETTRPSTEQISDETGHGFSENMILPDHSETEIPSSPPDELLTTASIELPVFAPLLLNLKCTNPGSLIGQEKSFFATLRIQGPRLPSHLKENLYLELSSLTATSKSGDLIQMGAMEFPYRLSADDALSLTYKLRLHGQGPQSMGSNPIVPISLCAAIKYVRLDKYSQSFTAISKNLSISWCPFIDLNSKQQPTLLPQNRRSVVVSSSSNSGKALPYMTSGLETTKYGPGGHSGIHGGIGPLGTNGGLSAASSPSLSITKSGSNNLKSKLSRSVALLPGSALAVTLNVSVPPTSILSGLKISFTGKLNFALGDVVTWKLQVINAGVRNLKLYMTAKRTKRTSSLYMQPNNSSYASSGLGITGGKITDREAKGVRFEGQLTTYNLLQLYNTYNCLKPARDGIVILTNDLDLGYLEAGQVYETEFKLVGFVKGIHTLDGLRIYDVNSGEGIELGRILEVFVV